MELGSRRDVLTVSGEKFLTLPLVDTSVDLCVYSTGDVFSAVYDRLVDMYGDVEAIVNGEKVMLSDVRYADEIYIPAQPDFDKNVYNAVDAMRVISRLMKKPGGCPWDSVQTHESIRINMIEEAYEAVDAIDKHDEENMIEEFGDVFLQALLQSAIAERDGEFDFSDVSDGLCKKLIARHTFIFGGDSAGNADDAIVLWEKNKAAEKHYTTLKDQLERLPETFPALLYSQKVYKKSKKANAAGSPKAELDAALDSSDYAAAICALAALLQDEGRDAEVEVNTLVKKKIADL